MTFEIKLPLFEGPFDLLLFFIERDELDIYDIPISKITNDFLEYLHRLEELNIEVASEFIVVAATLMRIKAKMLLPRPVLDEQGNEIDPREELVKHLLEYKKYKAVIRDFMIMEDSVLGREKRANSLREIRKIAETNSVEAELQDIDLYKLLKVFEKVMKRYEQVKNKPVHTITPFAYTVEGQKDYLLRKVSNKSTISFEEIIQDNYEKAAVVFNFLAILELLQVGIIMIHVGIGFNNFWIEKNNQTVESLM